LQWTFGITPGFGVKVIITKNKTSLTSQQLETGLSYLHLKSTQVSISGLIFLKIFSSFWQAVRSFLHKKNTLSFWRSFIS
jgi:hypothetical protein